MTSMQQFFDKTINTLATMATMATMAKRSQREETLSAQASLYTCVYESLDGYGCAVGMHLSPGPWMQFRGGVTALVEEYPRVARMLAVDGVSPMRGFSGTPYNDVLVFWRSMQKLHDQSLHWGPDGFTGWKSAQELADKFGLTFTLPEGVTP